MADGPPKPTPEGGSYVDGDVLSYRPCDLWAFMFEVGRRLAELGANPYPAALPVYVFALNNSGDAGLRPRPKCKPTAYAESHCCDNRCDGPEIRAEGNGGGGALAGLAHAVDLARLRLTNPLSLRRRIHDGAAFAAVIVARILTGSHWRSDRSPGTGGTVAEGPHPQQNGPRGLGPAFMTA